MLGLLILPHWCLLRHNVEAIEVRNVIIDAHLVQLTVVIDRSLLQLLFHLVLLRIFLHLEH